MDNIKMNGNENVSTDLEVQKAQALQKVCITLPITYWRNSLKRSFKNKFYKVDSKLNNYLNNFYVSILYSHYSAML